MQQSTIKPLLSTHKLSVGYWARKSRLEVLSNLNLVINPGELISFIGPNGCGKSTLIKSLIGLIPSLEGAIFFKDENLDHISFLQRAERIGVVLTDPVYERNLSVLELVSMGRYPHTNWLGQLTSADLKVVHDSIQKVGLVHKAGSRLGELSDGERQRAMISRVLAQDVDMIILDEPTAHLDLSNRMEVLLLLKKLAHEMGKGVLLSTHELGLALQVSDKIWMVGPDQQLMSDIPEAFIYNGTLDKVFGNEKISFQPWSASFEITTDKEKRIVVIGMGLLQACVVRLLKRLGYTVLYNETEKVPTVEVNEDSQEIRMITPQTKTFNSIHVFQEYLIQQNPA